MGRAEPRGHARTRGDPRRPRRGGCRWGPLHGGYTGGGVRRAAALALMLLCCQAASAGCRLLRLVELPVIMEGPRATIPARINGTGVRFMIDSGAAFSMLSLQAAASLRLPLDPLAPGIWLGGVGGDFRGYLTTVKELGLLQFTLPRVKFVVGGGSDLGGDLDGVIGQNLLRIGDDEYDLANGVIRLVRAEGCRRTVLAYWAGTQPYSVMDIDAVHASEGDPHTRGTAFLNGAKINVIFDTGAATSLLTRRAAARAGVHPGDPGVTPAGLSHGLGSHLEKTWSAHFTSFRIGDEEIRNARLRFTDTDLPDADMLVGADFFLAHHVYVANSQHRLYFTYNGGGVFTPAPAQRAAAGSGAAVPVNPTPAGRAQGGAQAGAGTGDAGASAPVMAGAAGPAPAGATMAPAGAAGAGAATAPTGIGEPTDASGFARRGAAYLARGDLAHALADLDRACALDSRQPDYFYQRGLARLRSGAADAARSDFDAALALDPRQVDALLARARLLLDLHRKTEAVADMDAADGLLSAQSDLRYELASLYTAAGSYAPALTELDRWAAAHEEDARYPQGLGRRCWVRAVLGQQLQQALKDCNAALRRLSSPDILDYRALALLKSGRLQEAIADWTAALQARPKDARALYGRGIAQSRLGRSAAARADLDAARAIDPRIAERASHWGLAPDHD